MLSQLIITSDPNIADNHIRDFCSKENIDPLDVTVISTEENIGIADVRETIKKIFFKPLKSLQKIVVIKKIDAATNEAQNALLKVLEEPPVNTGIILVAAAKERLLTTVISRCKIVNLEEPRPEATKPLAEKEPKVLLEQLNIMSTGEKLKFAQDLAKNKEKAISYLTGLLESYEKSMIKNHEDGIITLTKNILEAYKLALTTNVNIRFLLEHLFLSVTNL